MSNKLFQYCQLYNEQFKLSKWRSDCAVVSNAASQLHGPRFNPEPELMPVLSFCACLLHIPVGFVWDLRFPLIC